MNRRDTPLPVATERPTVRILGTHGVPAAYGGFETAAEHIALHLVRRGWRVVVYCQDHGTGPITEDVWQGVERVHVPVPGEGWRGTSHFDLRSVWHAARHRDLCLTFGYNTAALNLLQRLRGIPNVVNMDGMEWTRAKWGPVMKGILLANERTACRIADHLIADHPVIHDYLAGHAPADRITTITYGADAVVEPPVGPVTAWGLRPGEYSTVVCRPVPENSLLQIVTAFSARPRGHRLVVMGNLDRADTYHARVLAAASDEVLFPGAIYDPVVLGSLRYHGRFYLHGHTVGGTNPSLVEAMGAANAVIAHDNPYNRWVAGPDQLFFSDAGDLATLLDVVLDDEVRSRGMSRAARARHATEFTWARIAGQYEDLLRAHLPVPTTVPAAPIRAESL